MLVAVAEVVLAELAGDVALALSSPAMVGSSIAHAFGRAGQADLGQAGADRRLAGDEGGAARGAALLAVPVGEERAFRGDAVDVGRAVAHHAVVVGADVELADVVAPDDEDVRLLVLRRAGRGHPRGHLSARERRARRHPPRRTGLLDGRGVDRRGADKAHLDRCRDGCARLRRPRVEHPPDPDGGSRGTGRRSTTSACEFPDAVTLLAEALALSPRARVARILLRLAGSDGAVPGSQEDLGRLLGMTRSSVRRALTSLIDLGAVESGYGRLSVRDRAALERLTHEA
jgi:hypothetical protein